MHTLQLPTRAACTKSLTRLEPSLQMEFWFYSVKIVAGQTSHLLEELWEIWCHVGVFPGKAEPQFDQMNPLSA